MAQKRLMKLPIIAAVVMGPLTGEFISLVGNKLPPSKTIVIVRDLLSLPGGLVAGLFYPQGIDTGSGSIGFAYIAVAVNWLFYAVCWYTIIRLAIMLIRHVFRFPSNGSTMRA